MAEVDTTFVPNQINFPWSDTEAADTRVRGIRPLGQLQAVVRDGAVPLTGVGDTQTIICSLVLPTNFVYSLQDFSVSLSIAELPAAVNWETSGQLIFFDTTVGLGASQTYEYSLGLTSAIGKGNGDTTVLTFKPFADLPSFLLPGGGQLNLVLNNLTTNDVAAVFNYVARLLTYTVEQQFDSGVNTPLLVR